MGLLQCSVSQGKNQLRKVLSIELSIYISPLKGLLISICIRKSCIFNITKSDASALVTTE